MYYSFFFFILIIEILILLIIEVGNAEKYKLLNNYALECILNDLWEEGRFYLERASLINNEKNEDINNILANLAVVYEAKNKTNEALSLYKKIISDKTINPLFKENYKAFIQRENIIINKKNINKKIKLVNIKVEKEGILEPHKLDNIGLVIKNNIPNLATLTNTLLIQFDELLDFKIIQNTTTTYYIIVDIIDYKDTLSIDHKIKSKFSQKDQTYKFYKEKIIIKDIRIELIISLYKYNSLLLSKHYKEEERFVYNDEEDSSTIEKIKKIEEDFNNFILKFSKDFIESILPSTMTFKRYIFLY